MDFRKITRWVVNTAALLAAVAALPELGEIVPASALPVLGSIVAAVNMILSVIRNLGVNASLLSIEK